MRCWRSGTESHRGFVKPDQRVRRVVIGEWVDGLIHIEQPGGYVIFGNWCWRRSHGVGEHRTRILAKIVDHLVRHAGGTGKRGQWVEGDRAAGVHRVGANAAYGQRGERAIWRRLRRGGTRVAQLECAQRMTGCWRIAGNGANRLIHVPIAC